MTGCRSPRPTGRSRSDSNLEGPWLAHARKGAHDPALLREPADLRLADLEAHLDGLRLVTVAPELPGALDLIAWLHGRGVAVSMGHSAATIDEARAGYAAGGTSTTHLFNAMSGVDHRAPGLAVAALTDDAVYTELIADGVHVHPALWPLIARLKPVDRLLLVSDAIPLAGMGDGRARVGGLEVEVVGQRVTLVGTSTLAGSVIALDDAVRNLVGAGIALPAAVAAASRNPLALLGVTDRGRIATGQRADLVELDDALRVRRVMRGGVWFDASGSWVQPRGRLEVRPFTDDVIDDAAPLLASRHRQQRIVEPGLSPVYEDVAAARTEIATLAAKDGASGAVALRGGQVVGYLVGAPRAPSWGPNIWVEGSGHAVAEPEIARDLYGFAARAGWTRARRATTPSSRPRTRRSSTPGSEVGSGSSMCTRSAPRRPPVRRCARATA